MINPHLIGLMQTAGRTSPGSLVQFLRFWRDAGDENHKKDLKYWRVGLMT
jgi:hypothetical protein